MSFRLKLLLGCALLLLVVSLGLRWWFSPLPPDQRLAEIRALLAQGDASQAEQLCRVWLQDEPHQAEVLLLAAQAALEQNHPEQAVAYLAAVPPSESALALRARYQAGELLLQQGQASEAEKRFRQVLVLDPAHRPTHEQLARLLQVEGRSWEAAFHWYTLLRLGERSADALEGLILRERWIPDRSFPERLHQQAPQDPAPLFGMARIAWLEGKSEEALRYLQQATRLADPPLAAHAELGLLLAETGRDDELVAWNEALPAEAEQFPGVWLARGFWARRHDQLEAAARCFWEAARRDPDSASAQSQLASVLGALGRHAEAAKASQRASLLEQLALTALRFHRTSSDQACQETVQLLETLGRLPEAVAWTQLAASRTPPPRWALDALRRFETQLTANSPRVLPSADPAQQIQLASFALPQWPARAASQTLADTPGSTLPAATIRFDEEARARGIEFTYLNSADPETPGARMFEYTGGGVAVLDYDQDGWPDLYFAQGCAWPPRADDITRLDRLYRNLGNGEFADVTQSAGLVENRYSQGVAAGDFNNDGWPDLYVANIGRNRLYLNNGDGTFTDRSDSAGLKEEQWTASCAMVDLNGDGWAELYDVNYLRGEGVFDRICRENDVYRACHPTVFEADQDQLHLNRGDGQFENITREAGIVAPEGMGLGVLAADFDGDRRVDLFVANDSKPNFLFMNRTSPGEKIQVVESAVSSGVAYDRDGRPQACMGIATGDFDGNQRLDLLVTNYLSESNAAYLQLQDGYFEDGSRRTGHHYASFHLLGFGCQAFDADLDGWLDFAIANGHVDDYSIAGLPYRMRTQVLRGMEDGKVEEISAEQLGAYFQGEYLGRGLARLDWNRDGREDFVVSHLDTPVALLTNKTSQTGHGLSLRLVATRGARDATGAQVRVTCGDRHWTAQLTAGDGYMATNQRQLVLGIGEATQIDELLIRWPSGAEQRLTDLPVDRELLVIEGRSEGFLAEPQTVAK